MTFSTYKLANIYAGTLTVVHSISVLDDGSIRVEGEK